MKTNIFKIGKREIVIIAITLVIGISLGSLFFGSSSNENAKNIFTQKQNKLMLQFGLAQCTLK